MLNWKENIGKYANEKLVTFYISLFSITESIINPIPVEVILIPSVIKFREKFINPIINTERISQLYQEFAEEDRQLAEQGINEYAELLKQEDQS